jgi:hypothetical protein
MACYKGQPIKIGFMLLPVGSRQDMEMVLLECFQMYKGVHITAF